MPELSLSVKSAIKVKRGKKLVVTAIVRNSGDGTARGVRLKVTAPGKLTRKVKGQTAGTIGPGDSVVRKFRIPVRPAAKGRFRIKVTMTGSGKQLTRWTRTVRVK